MNRRYTARHSRFVVLIVLAWAASMVVQSARAQSSGSSVSVCETRWVDEANYIEQTVCLYGDASSLTGYADTEDYGYEYLGQLNTFVPNVKGMVVLYLGNTQVAESTGAVNITPQISALYRLAGFYSECYDPSGNGNGGSCSWGGYLDGPSVQAEVTPASPTVNLTSSRNPSTYGDPVTFTATFSNALSGIVEFRDTYGGGRQIGTASINGTSVSFTISSLNVGQDDISATWPGDSNYSAASATVSLIVNKATPSVSSWPNASTITYGQSLASSSLSSGSASVSGSFSWNSSGTVPGAGTSSQGVTFTPSDTTNYNSVGGSVSVSVNQATPSISISNIPSNVGYGGSFTVTYSYSGSGSPAMSISSSTTGVCTVSGNTVNYVGTGTCTLIPSASATANYTAVAGSAQSFTVSSTIITPSITLTTSGTPAAYSSYVTFTATVTTGDTNPVTFYAGSTALGAVIPSNGVASLSVNTLASGDSIITASIASGGNYASATSNSITQTVTAPSNPLYSFSIVNGSASGYDAVGNVIAYTDSVNGTWTFSYDSLNRLTTGTSSIGAFSGKSLCWSYDAFGNRTVESEQTVSCPAQSTSTWVYGADNRVSGVISPGGTQPSPSPYTYDDAGNVTIDLVTGNQYLYDGEGRICAATNTLVQGLPTMVQYIYDAEGRRVAKGTISSWSCDTDSNNFTATTIYVLGLGGEQLSELTNSAGTWKWAHTNVYAGGMQIATYTADSSGQTAGSVYFHLADWLGTRRQSTDYAGNPCMTFTGLPYGSMPLQPNLAPCLAPSQDPTEHHFTGKERDTESGNDYFGARYYASSMGRWLSPDWSAKAEPVPYAKLDDPQSLNLYSYVLNNPLTREDADGHSPVWGEEPAQQGSKLIAQQQITPPPALQGTLTINTISTRDPSFAGSHSWITFTPDGGTTTTYGTYGNANGAQGVQGVNVNSETGLTPTTSRSAHISADQAAALRGYVGSEIKKGSGAWSYTAPCSSFASGAWQAGTGEKLSPSRGGVLSTPTNLGNAITNANSGRSSGVVAPSPRGPQPVHSSSFPW